MLEYGLLIIIIALAIGFVMTWGVGANDLANIMSTAMGSKSLTVPQAMMIAVIFEIAGALLNGAHVTHTIKNGIINTGLLAYSPYTLVFGMLSVLLASGTWMLFASYIAMPVSITNAIVGSIVGFGLIVLGPHAVHWHIVITIAISWICAPTISCIVSYFLFIIIKRTIFNQLSPAKSAHRAIPIYFFIVGMVLTDMTILKGLEHFHVYLSSPAKFFTMIICSLIFAIVGNLLTKKIPFDPTSKRFRQHIYVEKLFSVLMAFTACAMVFAHGSNDVAIAMGPIAAIMSIVRHNGDIANSFPHWILLFGCIGVITGLFMYGRKVIITVGTNITDLTPSRAFAATLASATTVIVSTSTGIPVSATQTLVGGVLGVGLARGIGALNVTTLRNIFMSWVITVPVAAILSVVFYYLLTYLFGA